MLFWTPIVDLSVISILLLIATVLRARSEFVQKLLIPNALLAGFIGLILRFIFQRYLGVTMIDTQLGTAYVYHLLNISFAALAITAPIPFRSIVTARLKGPSSTGIYMSFMLCLQSFVGFLVTIILIRTFYPDLFANFGFMMAWGFTLGPGQAASIGQGLETVGFTHGGSIGLIFGALGFVWACFIGIPLIHWGIRKGYASFVKSPEEICGLSGILGKGARSQSAGKLTTSSEAIDTLTLQLVLCALVYFLAYSLVGSMITASEVRGSEMGGVLWGFVFLFTALIGVQVRYFMDRLKVGHVVDPGIQTRISGTCVDYMVATAVTIIPLTIAWEYAVPILLIGTIGGITTLLVTMWLTKRIWDDHHFERLILCYGTLTGTIGTGMALLRVIDPHYRSPVALHYALGMWLTLLFMAPLLVVQNLTVSMGNEIVLVILFAYTCFLFSMWRVMKLWNVKKPFTKLWPEE